MNRGRIGDAGRRAETKTFERTRASGAWVGAKGDLRSDDFALESKATERGSYSLKLETLRKIAREAEQSGRRPALAVQFVDGTGRPRHEGAWVLVREQDFVEMTTPEGEE